MPSSADPLPGNDPRASLVDRLKSRLISASENALPITIVLSIFVGVAGGLGALAFGWWINVVGQVTLKPVWASVYWASFLVPVAGLLVVSWLTRRFAPEAQGHGVPEVIAAVAQKGGVIRPRVATVKTLASGLTIGMGGSVGREGPIVQIGSATGSVVGQWFALTERKVKTLVAAGAAAGISATFGAPLAGVMFASEVILGTFAVSSLTPIVIAAVIANLVAQKGIYLIEPERIDKASGAVLPVFNEARELAFDDPWLLPLYITLGLACGVAAVCFTRMVYATEDGMARWLPQWYGRALVAGLIVGACGMLPGLRPAAGEGGPPLGYLFGVGYEAVRDVLSLDPTGGVKLAVLTLAALLLLKYLATSVTLAGGGSGGIFAPSLFLGAMLGGLFGQLCGLALPASWDIHPGAFALVGMAAVVAGTTHGPMSAVLILFEMTQDYNMILPLMCAAGLASVTSRVFDSESIYEKKLSRRGELTAWGHHTTALEDIHVRDLMITNFPTVPEGATLDEIVRVATKNPHLENLPVVGSDGRPVGIIRAEELHRMLDWDMQGELVRAEDIVQRAPARLSPDQNLLEAMREFGHYADTESLPVVLRSEAGERFIGILARIGVMQRYRQEMLRHRSGETL